VVYVSNTDVITINGQLEAVLLAGGDDGLSWTDEALGAPWGLEATSRGEIPTPLSKMGQQEGFELADGLSVIISQLGSRLCHHPVTSGIRSSA
jgi:hypothetical protein